ncbi:hypothetical protein Fot_57134 [Forsythia ovata]|uniref:Uncharacterized protein n=1 Tax=Forsythia ovata TaxID=205694 RepID=A0ABD1NY45_9LAMI
MKLDAIASDVVELQDALPQAQVDAKNDEAEDTDADVNANYSEKKMRSKYSLDRTPQHNQMHKHDQEVVHGSTTKYPSPIFNNLLSSCNYSLSSIIKMTQEYFSCMLMEHSKLMERQLDKAT